jgi:hypothetical protein
MTDVQTREGIFGGGGYGGGLFDGTNMGFGGLGGLGAFPSPSKYPNGYPGATYTAKSGETGSSIAKDITGNPNRYSELVTANPETKNATYGMAFNPGKVLKLPVSWQATASAAPSTYTDSPTPILSSSSSETAPSSSPTTPATSAMVPASDDGMSTATIVGIAGVALVVGFFMMRKK